VETARAPSCCACYTRGGGGVVGCARYDRCPSAPLREGVEATQRHYIARLPHEEGSEATGVRSEQPLLCGRRLKPLG
jgi:hypothetical protein